MGTLSHYARLLVALSIALIGPVQAADKAMVVSVSRYPYLQNRDLDGPVNDAALMLRALKRLGFAENDITLLAEGPAARALPTRSNILAHLRQAAELGRPGDWLVVYFAGHGSQQPQLKPRHGYQEPDGLDEIFLPRDTRRWLPEKSVVDGALRDDDIGIALARLTEKGVNVWAIFDTCHAGDMAKSTAFGADAPIYRYVSPYSLGVPVELIARVFPRKPARTRVYVAQAEAPQPPPSAGHLVVFYAAGPDEPAAEERLPSPANPAQRLRYGVFTYALHQQLDTWNGNFQSLAEGLTRFYKDRPFPTPMFEGALHVRPPFPSLLAQPDKSPRAVSMSMP